MMGKMEDFNQALDELMEMLRNGKLKTSDGSEDLSKERNEFMALQALKHAEGSINVTLERKGKLTKCEMHAKGNRTALVVAAYHLIGRVVENSPGITFDEVIEWLKYMEALRNGPDGSGEGDE